MKTERLIVNDFLDEFGQFIIYILKMECRRDKEKGRNKGIYSKRDESVK